MKNKFFVFFYIIFIDKVYNELNISNDQKFLEIKNLKLNKTNSSFLSDHDLIGILKYLDLSKNNSIKLNLTDSSTKLKTLKIVKNKKKNLLNLKSSKNLKTTKIPISYQVLELSKHSEPLQVLESNQNLNFSKKPLDLQKNILFYEEDQSLSKLETLNLIKILNLLKNLNLIKNFSSLKTVNKLSKISRSDNLNKNKKKNKCNCECKKDLFITVPKYKYIDIPLAKEVSNRQNNFKEPAKKIKNFSKLNENVVGYNRKKRKAKTNYISRSFYNDYDNNVDDFDYNSDLEKSEKNEFDYSSKMNKKPKEQIDYNDKVIFDELEDDYVMNDKPENTRNLNKFNDKNFNSGDYDILNNKQIDKDDYLIEKPERKLTDELIRKNKYKENYEDSYDDSKEDSEDDQSTNQDDYENKKNIDDQEEDYEEA